MVEVLALPHRVPSLGRAVEQFLAAKPLSASGRRSYAHTLRTVVGDLGGDLALNEFTAERLRRVLEDRWGDASAATWNNRLTAVGSFRRWTQSQGWIAEDPLAGIERRPQARDDTAQICYEQLHALWTRPDVHVREKTLWRMLYETAARANEILALNIEDLDVGARRAVIRGKGGHRQEVVWASGTARLLPRYPCRFPASHGLPLSCICENPDDLVGEVSIGRIDRRVPLPQILIDRTRFCAIFDRQFPDGIPTGWAGLQSREDCVSNNRAFLPLLAIMN